MGMDPYQAGPMGQMFGGGMGGFLPGGMPSGGAPPPHFGPGLDNGMPGMPPPRIGPGLQPNDPTAPYMGNGLPNPRPRTDQPVTGSALPRNYQAPLQEPPADPQIGQGDPGQLLDRIMRSRPGYSPFGYR